MMTAKFDIARVTQTTVRDLVEIFGPSGVSVDREKVTAYSRMKLRYICGIKNILLMWYVLPKIRNRYLIL